MRNAVLGFVESYRKPLLFALYGGLGSLVGAILGEAFVASLRAALQEPAAVTAGQPPGVVKTQQGQEESRSSREEDTLFGKMPISAERKREILKTIERGEIEIVLYWKNHNDLDLHCIDPDGEEIYWKYKQSRSGGFLDLDANSSMHPPWFDEPAEHIRWRKGEAPSGHYQVFVEHFRDHQGGDPTPYWVSVKAPGLDSTQLEGTLSTGDPKKRVFEFDVRPVVEAPVTPPTESATTGSSRLLSLALVIGLYTALIAVCLSFALVIGQNRYQHLPLLTLHQGLIVLLGSAAAGLVAGVVIQGLFGLIAQGWTSRHVSRLVGWTVLGAILGRGMGLFIPNLPGKRASVAGGLGGFLGSLALLSLGEGFGRVAGATLLGACIGVMIVLVEELAREAWLVVSWGPNEKVNISLGRQPVLIGSSPKVYLPRNKGYPEEWATIQLDLNQA